MNPRERRYCALLLVIVMVGTLLAGCSKPQSLKEDINRLRQYVSYGQGHGFTFDTTDPDATQAPDAPTATKAPTLQLPGKGPTPDVDNQPDNEPDEDPTQVHQLTIEEIQEMNGDSLVIDIYNNQGYLSTLVGKYYAKKVTNPEDGVLSLRGMASLLGLTKGCEFFIVYSEKDDDGFTYYTYQQRYGGHTLRNATLRIVVDPEGYTAGLTCSFTPNIGTASQDPAISAADAEKIVLDRFSAAGVNLELLSGRTVRMATTVQNVVYNCWVVYTRNPDVSASFDMPYLEHYVTTDGEYVTLIPSNTFSENGSESMNVDIYFEPMTQTTITKNVKLQTGETRKVTVPVCKNKNDGLYYLMDKERKIAVADYYDFNYMNTVSLVSGKSADGWSDNNLLAYANIIKAYDYYAERGIQSVDGFGKPILITVGWCDANRNPVDNACFYGVINGWACFGISDINHYGDALDVIGHEYTHGITRQSMQGNLYRNETGAINEAFSDIMGNIMEMILGDTKDTKWLMAENTGEVIRDMGDPNRYEQPAYVGDQYYWPAVYSPDHTINDQGGVHVNSSLLNRIAYLLDQGGMSLDDQFSLWMTSIEIMTPLSDYEDLHGILLFALKINGQMQQYGAIVNQAFAEEGLNDDWSKSYLQATKPGFGRVMFETDEYIAKSWVRVIFADASTSQTVAVGVPDMNGVVSMLVPAGNYIAQFRSFTDDYQAYNYNYTGSGWVEGGNWGVFTVNAGSVVTLTSASSGRTPSSGDNGGGSSEPAPQTKTGLDLITFDGGYFSLMMPRGWRIEVNGQYGAFSFKIFDPENPSMQAFLYGALAPFHKSYASRSALARVYDPNGMVSNGPVLPEVSSLGILSVWPDCIEFQKRYEKQYFTDLYNINALGQFGYNGFYTSSGAIESAALVSCSTNYDNDCLLTLSSSLIDTDTLRIFGGNFYYHCFSLTGILAPRDQYDAVFSDLLTCIQSITFTEDYIRASQSSENPMNTNDQIHEGGRIIGQAMTKAYQDYK